MRTATLRLNLNSLFFFVAMVFFRCVLDFSYSFVVAENFSSEGFHKSFEIESYIASWAIYLSSLFFVRARAERVSHYFFVISSLSIIAPLTSIYGLDSDRPVFPVLISILAVFVVYIFSRIRIFNFKLLPVVVGGRKLAIGISFSFVAFLMLWYFYSGAKPNLNMNEVYEYRVVNSEISGGGLFEYTNSWTFQIFSIYLICFSLFYKRYIYFFALLAVQIYFFSIASHKSILFYPLLVAGVWFYFRKSNSLLVLPLVFSLVLAVSIASYFFYYDIWLTSLLSRRVFFVPANLCFVYFDFFSSHPLVYWSNSILSPFITYEYGEVSLPRVIGEYLGKKDMAANNGFVSSGFAHAGLWGSSCILSS